MKEKRTFDTLFKAAKTVLTKAYAPYSKFRVGAALVDEKGQLHVGCNVENASYGATVCAERSAISAMIGQGGRRVQALLVLTEKGTSPCGICRQVLAEFMEPEAPILIAGKKGLLQAYTIQDLLPDSFGPKNLR